MAAKDQARDALDKAVKLIEETRAILDYIANKEGDPIKLMLKSVIDEKLVSILSYVMIAKKFMDEGGSVDKLVEEVVEKESMKSKEEAKGLFGRISTLGKKVIGTES
jgi:hypothetical protein